MTCVSTKTGDKLHSQPAGLFVADFDLFVAFFDLREGSWNIGGAGMRFNPDKRFLDKINKINKIELSLSAQGKEEFRPDQMLSNLCL